MQPIAHLRLRVNVNRKRGYNPGRHFEVGRRKESVEWEHRAIVMFRQQTYIADAGVDSASKTVTDAPSQQHVEC